MPGDAEGREGALRDLVALHCEVDEGVARLEERHAGRLQCGRGCSSCCVDEITVFAVEAERIRRSYGDLLAEGSPHAPGACAFLDAAGSCRVYAARPYVCRSQGLPLRWLEEMGEEEGAEIVERRDICPLNIESLPPSVLREEDCWQIGPIELRLGEIEERFSHGRLRRLGLRTLFGRGA
ncbi:MAG: YkgJ family cysteine cluster protein [Deltaproteobacteria bacterium]|nr:YkgJ family cysteine cluster protein [Deltaproteobacteria bacterium]